MNDVLFEKLQAQLLLAGLFVEAGASTDTVTVSDNNKSCTVSVAEADDAYEDGGNLSPLFDLLESVLDFFEKTLVPGWSYAKAHVYLYLLPSNYDFQQAIHHAVTGELHQAFVYYNSHRYTLLNEAHLNAWQIGEPLLRWQANENMNLLLENSRVELLETDSHERIAILETPAEQLVSALILSTHLWHKVMPVIGFPVYCAVPVRNRCYLFAESDTEALIDILAETVMTAYEESEAKLTTEILQIGHHGVKAIGKYAL